MMPFNKENKENNENNENCTVIVCYTHKNIRISIKYSPDTIVLVLKNKILKKLYSIGVHNIRFHNINLYNDNYLLDEDMRIIDILQRDIFHIVYVQTEYEALLAKYDAEEQEDILIQNNGDISQQYVIDPVYNQNISHEELPDFPPDVEENISTFVANVLVPPPLIIE
jgi:hypothetical protein